MTLIIWLLNAPFDAFSCGDRLEWRTEIEQQTINSSRQSKYLELELMMRPA
ncbi:MAG: hypothetical protein WBB28_02865 [Crinalium sp.]